MAEERTQRHHQTPQTAKDDYLDRPIWGAARIGHEAGKSAKAASHLLAKGLIDADKCGRLWVSTPRRVRRIGNGGSA